MANDLYSNSVCKEWILHADGDAFFASCEVSRRPDLFGKPVVVGEERGIASAFTYSAKALGIKRGYPIFKIKKEYPQVVILSSHFELYRRFSRNLKEILMPYLSSFENYSIDECFGTIVGTEEQIKEKVIKMKLEVERKLGITYSFGVSTTKTLAKLASKRNKPAGYCFLFSNDEIQKVLKTTKVEDVWGIGYQTQKRLKSKKIITAYDFVNFDLSDIKKDTILDSLHRPHFHTQEELNGISHFKISINNPIQKSIQSTRSFIKKTNRKSEILSELSRNLESACSQLRQMDLYTDKVYFFVKKERGEYSRYGNFGKAIDLPNFTNSSMSIYKLIEQAFDKFEIQGRGGSKLYRSSGVVLYNLCLKEDLKMDLFNVQENIIVEENKLTKVVDDIRKRFGYQAIQTASSRDSDIKRNKQAKQRDGRDSYEYGLPYPFMGIIL